MITDFGVIWQNIGRYAGQTFATASGQAFAYDVQDDTLAIRRSDMVLNKQDIEAAHQSGAANGKENGRGTTAYIYALLRDVRIRT